MTNKEWLESLSNVKFAEVLCDAGFCEKWCAYGGSCRGNCVLGVTEWLQAEHKESKKEFTQSQLNEIFKNKFANRRVISLEEVEITIKGVFEEES